MALAEKPSCASKADASPEVGSLPSPRRKRRLRATLFAAAVLIVFAVICILGHPFLAIWLLVALMSWLFMRGVARLSSETGSGPGRQEPALSAFEDDRGQN